MKFDPQQHEARRHLERWAPLAASRSRLVKEDLLVAAKLRRRLRWRFFGGYEGIVEIWDEKRSGKDPVQDTDDRFEVVKKGDAWLIREFPRTIPERGAKS